MPPFAAQMQESTTDILQSFAEIGSGGCGKVFEQIGTTQVVKMAHHKNGDLWKDYLMHKKIEEGFDLGREIKSYTPAKVPRAFHFIGADNAWWETNARRFPSNSRTPANLLLSERVMPIPKPIRDVLVSLYCPAHLKEAQNTNSSNNACLIRVYLGERKDPPEYSRQPVSFTLRNFPLDLNRMANLGLDVESLARSLADTLALMHWIVKLDAQGVEFVLGSTPIESHFHGPDYHILSKLPKNASTIQEVKGLAFHNRKVQLWMLDFNQCSPITMDKAGVDQATQAFCINDPYFPRPDVDLELWNVFSDRYLLSSKRMVQDTKYDYLPALFIEKVVSRMDGIKKAKMDYICN
jgi:Zinc finger protein